MGRSVVGPDARTVSGLHFMNKNTKCTHKSQGVWGTQIKISDKCYTSDKYRRPQIPEASVAFGELIARWATNYKLPFNASLRNLLLPFGKLLFQYDKKKFFLYNWLLNVRIISIDVCLSFIIFCFVVYWFLSEFSLPVLLQISLKMTTNGIL